jgi:hypothetical protein
MPYVTSIERLARCDGLRDGIEVLLKVRYGDEGLKLMPEIREILEEEKLREVLKARETAASPGAVRRLWAPDAS